MKRRSAILLMSLLMVLPLAAEEGRVALASVSTSVGGYVLHGFLEKADNSLREAVVVDNALGKDGADLLYTIRTNQEANMVVHALISPFEQQSGGGDGKARISVDSVSVNGVAVSPLPGNGQRGVAKADDGMEDEKYALIRFTGEADVTEYRYTIHITANQSEVRVAPAGRYLCSVTISLAYEG